ncbi:gliding motility-associated C-terminal domain-containing protein [Hymenobacter persicinus]|uniref:Gliding motility-associated C-terminal domain-containing protein n=1 Tax=Hymenobacter persicinus TaxID=2025506 RepID=A0A4Q5LAZ6_9BACT|nr:gliding motility-associated C-terminal domain-containing protein [Hymenobacter persicinus]RYU79316.1 gliding motility-associated C-terminal domain-containing protein [Hymenobacter persicinus]
MPIPLLRTCFLLLIWLGLGLGSAGASHLVGGELNYVYLDANGPAGKPYRYQITARIYFNKEPGSSNPNGSISVPIEVFSKGPGGQSLEQLIVPRRSFSEITPPLLPGCSLQAPRVTLALYIVTVALPAVTEGYLVTLAANYRNAGITNIVLSGGTSMALSVDMTPPMLLNSSPVFSTNALAVICRGDTTAVINNAYDADGDRLSYSLGAPNQAVLPVVPVDYTAGYSPTQPFGATGYAAVDARSGVARYLGRQEGTFLLAVDVREYRVINGREVLLGTMRRDIQVVVRTCSGGPNQPPAFTAATLARRDFVVEDGQSLDFAIAATDPDPQQLTLSVSSVLLDGGGPIDATFSGQTGNGTGGAPGTVSLTGVSGATGTFHLTAGCGLARPAAYDVVVTAVDAACNSKSVATAFRITVTRPAPPTGVRGDSVLCAQSVGTYTALGPVFPQYRWTARGGRVVGSITGRTVQVEWLTGGAGAVTVRGLPPSGCPTDSATRPVQVKLGPQITGAAVYCLAAHQGLTYTIDGPPGAYQWTITGGTLVSGQGTNTVRVDVVRGGTAVLQAASPSLTNCVTLLRISPDDACLAFFNVITPNGDGLNDTFVIENLARYPNTELTIFNRWGRQLYYSPDYHNDYAGATAGTYYYLCRLADGTRYRGWFEVVR